MIAVPTMLMAPAIKAGMKVPPEDEVLEGRYNPEEYPHFHVFLYVQLGSPMPNPHAHWDNAKLIASISDEEIRTVTGSQLEQKGLQIGYSK